MTTNNTTISIDYSDAQLRQLVEEYITQQRSSFTLKGVCSYVLYWAMEDGHTTCSKHYECAKLSNNDCDRVNNILDKIIQEERIIKNSDGYETIIK